MIVVLESCGSSNIVLINCTMEEVILLVILVDICLKIEEMHLIAFDQRADFTISGLNYGFDLIYDKVASLRFFYSDGGEW